MSPWPGRLRIRTRITLGSVLVALVVLVGASAALHVQFAHATAATDRSLAAGDAAPFVQDLRQNPDELPDRPSEGALVGVRARDGQWLVDTLPEAVRRGLPRTAPRAEDDPGRDDTLVVRDGDERWTVVGERVHDVDVWAARDARAGEETLRRIDRTLVIGTLLAVLAFAGTAWLLTGAALRPVERMQRTADTLGADGDGHLPVGPAEDELTALARTLNRFVDRQREDAARGRRMVSDASHELRTPLAALTARLELAHRHRGDADALEAELAAAERDTARLAALATSLLELTRLDDAPADVERSTVAELVTEVMAAVDRVRSLPEAAGRDVDLRTTVTDDSVRVGIGSPAFARIVDNLAANAVAATAPGGSVRLALDQDDTGLVLTVTDDGTGVPEDFLPRAFERFARADPSRRSVLGSSGLGLALVRGTAERAGGTATLRNRADGHGAVAEVRLPRR